MKNISLNSVRKAHEKYLSEINKIQTQLKDFVEFEFFIVAQEGDGFVIVHIEETHNAPLEMCISIIKEKGTLTYSDYKAIQI